MKINKKLALVMATVATVTSIGATAAFADCKDSSWGFSKWERVELTGSRTKDNDSSAYGKVSTGGDKHITYFSIVDRDGNDIRYNGTGSKQARTTAIIGNSSSEVINLAYENSYTEVRMKIWRGLGDMGGEATGLWSPDYCRP